MKNNLLWFFFLFLWGCPSQQSSSNTKCKTKQPSLLQGTYKDGDEWLCYTSGAWRKKARYLQGRLHGELLYWYPDGKKKTHTEFQKGQLHGIFRTWHASGKPFDRGQYVHGRREGLWKEWRPSGSLKIESHYVKGELSGKWVQYSPTQEIVLSGIYKKNHKCGTWACKAQYCVLAFRDRDQKCKLKPNQIVCRSCESFKLKKIHKHHSH